MTLTANLLISVVMPVHNALPFLDESIRSIVEQTLGDFELVILNDASTDGSASYCANGRAATSAYICMSMKPLGLAGSSNAAVAKARAAIVARMDADDIAHPDRLRRLWSVIRARPDVAAIGTHGRQHWLIRDE